MILPILLGVFLIWWSLSSLTPMDKEEIKKSFENVHYFWIFISLFLGLLSHLSRAYRWKFLLEPLGYKPKFLNSVFTIFTAYLINLFLPRAGEIARATGISKYEAIPFEKAFGTIVAERIIDVIMLLLIVMMAFFYQFDLLADLVLQKLPKNPFTSFLILLIFAVFLYWMYRLIKKSERRLFIKIRHFAKGLLDGIKSVLAMKKRRFFIAHTIFIWLMYLLMFYTASFSLQETAHLSVGAVISGFVVGALSIATTNGGLGTYPVGVQRLLHLYGIALNPALAFGWIMWSAQTFMILLFGGLSLLFIPLYNRKFFQLQ